MISGSPILVTGSTRSGTSWTGKMLCLSGEAGYVNEPFNQHYQPGWAGCRLPHQSLYICADNEHQYTDTIDRVVAMRYPLVRNLRDVRSPRAVGRLGRDFALSIHHRMRRTRPLLKDPYAFFSSEWLAGRYKMAVVVTIRHPAGFVSSIKRLGWKRNFRHWADQPLLLRDLLAGYSQEIRMRAGNHTDGDIIDHAILAWNGCYSIVGRWRNSHPEWVFVRYEDLAHDPVTEFRRIYERLGLSWTAAAESGVAAHSTAGSMSDPDAVHSVKRDSRAAESAWGARLDPQEVARVRAATESVASLFYSDADWKPASSRG